MHTVAREMATEKTASAWHLAGFLCAFMFVALCLIRLESFVTRQLFSLAAHLALALLVVSRVSGLRFPRGFAIVRDLALGAGCAAVAWFAWDVVVRFIPPDPGQFSRPHSLFTTALYLILGVVIGPITEEIIFRGYVLQQITYGAGSLAAIFLQAVLFGAIHFRYGLSTQAIIAITGGLPFGILAYTRKNLWPGIFAHAFYNLALLIPGAK